MTKGLGRDWVGEDKALSSLETLQLLKRQARSLATMPKADLRHSGPITRPTVRGLWLYKLPSRIQVNYRQRCLDWLSHEGQPSAWNKGLPRCPCSLKQARSDKRYTQSKKGLPDSRLTMLYSSTPNKYGAGVRCLYNNNNQLVEGHQERIWKDTRKSSPYNDEELKLYDWCCNQAGNPQLCDKYNQKRPRVGCDGYRPPVQSEFLAFVSSEGELFIEMIADIRHGPWG
ncbi:mucin-4 [Tiliqua scincoides]|uniref:mucin-4 n=1 Tax=Tiliqua scincoides TaxID=71010 RepID=UPI003461DDB6